MQPQPDADTRRVMRQIKHQIVMANIQELLATISCKCFEKCVANPRDRLSNQEQHCIGMCMDRYMESYRLCAGAYGHRLRREYSREQQQ